MLLQLQLRTTLFPYTTLFRSPVWEAICTHSAVVQQVDLELPRSRNRVRLRKQAVALVKNRACFRCETISMDSLAEESRVDRKSTRLNSSHSSISYAVFCLKKK